MAIITAVRSGNWSDTSHVTGPWPGGSTPTTKPGIGDTVRTGAYVVTIDEDVHVALLESTSSGYFKITNAPTLPAVRAITAGVLNSGTAAGALQVTNATGLVTQTGNATGGAGSNAHGITNVGVMGNMIGDATGGGGYAAYGIYNDGGIIGNITGNATGGGGEVACGIFNISAGTIGNITGNVTGGEGDGAYGIRNSAGTIGNITGNVSSDMYETNYGIRNEGAIGNITGNVIGRGILTIGTMGGVDGAIVCPSSGQFPIQGPFKLIASAANAVTFISSTDTPLTLSNDYPAEADVKDGVDYNRGTMTGELAAGGGIGPVSIVIGGGGIRIS